MNTAVTIESTHLYLVKMGDVSAYLTGPQAEKLVEQIQAAIGKKERFSERVKRVVAEVFECSIQKLCGPERSDRLATARWIAYSLMREAGMQPKQIGKAFNRGRDTVAHGLKQLENRIHIQNDCAVIRSIEQIKEALKNS